MKHALAALWTLVQWLSHLGVRRHKDPAVRRRVLLTNAMALTLVVLVLPYFPILERLGQPLLAWAVPLIAGAYLGAVALNHLGRFSLARLLLITILNGAIFVYSGFLGPRAGGHLYLLATACLPIIIASVRERRLLVYGVCLPILCFEILTLARDRVFPAAIIGAGTQSWIYRAAVVPSTFIILLSELIYFSVVTERAKDRLEGLLDSAGQGFLTLDRRGAIGPDWSRVIESWLSGLSVGGSFVEVLRQIDGATAEWFELGWEVLFADQLPLELALEQLPQTLRAGERHLRIEYRPFFSAGSSPVLERVLLVISDITGEVDRSRDEQAQKEVLQVVDHAVRDHAGFLEFHQEMTRLLALLERAPPPDELRHILHTVKGSCALYGVTSVSERCHELESRLAEDGAPPTAGELHHLRAGWSALCERLAPIIHTADGRVGLLREEYELFIEALARRVSHWVLLAQARTWRFEPVEVRFQRIAEQAQALARRLGKGEIEVSLHGGGVRLEPERWAGFFSALVHVVLNAVDHGLEPPTQRLAAGKTAGGRLELRARRCGGEVVLSLSDDGRGIDWERIAASALKLGLPAQSRADLEQALFTSGLSTQAEVSELSGRGVGLAAMRAACGGLGGWIAVQSSPGQGTCFEFHVPTPASAWRFAGSPVRLRPLGAAAVAEPAGLRRSPAAAGGLHE